MPIAPAQAQKQIVKLLEQNTVGGRRLSQVFDDFVYLAQASLERQPDHLVEYRTSGRMAEDTPATKELWQRTRAAYGDEPRQYFERFRQALTVLMQTDGEQDILGAMYMELGNPSERAGQFFTPYSLAVLCAKMTIEPLHADMVYQRIAAALHTNPDILNAFLAIPETDVRFQAESSVWFWLEFFDPVYPAYKPITVYDPACGSAVMLLACAEMVPDWMNTLGLFEYFGQDISGICAAMASINFMLAGLNRYKLRCLVAQERDPFPPAAVINWDLLRSYCRETAVLGIEPLTIPIALLPPPAAMPKVKAKKQKVQADQLSLFSLENS